MGWATGIAVYVVTWWIVIFMVFPWGVQTIGEEDVAKGHAPSAPKRPLLLRKLAVTTLVAAVLWTVFYLIAESGMISFRESCLGFLLV
jgi:predicted secreted protein